MYKNQLCFCILAMNNQKLKLKTTIYNSVKNVKYVSFTLIEDMKNCAVKIRKHC